MTLGQTVAGRGDGTSRDSIHDSWIRCTDLWLTLGAVASVPLFILENRFGPTATTSVQIANWAIWGAFAMDFGVRLVLTDLPVRRYLRKYWFDAALVFLALIPVVRPLRVLRSARILRLLRLTAGAGFILALWRGRGSRAWRELRGGNALVAVGALVVLAPLSVWLLERRGDGPIDTLGEAVWWGAATVTTVGYGDVAPVTWLGRAIAIVLMLAGIRVCQMFCVSGVVGGDVRG
ncbi:MAG: potassium channel family protein, partial [Acidimicrobiales bacterium]|nr:potassium channel family protein [Acidimicrobiales bacterium]MYH74280.1 potassium channel family protein [Acidimicrobiales bacterium]MYK72175.1 potassium channel family protein [Acidimicrobiales bacterium]